jgi:hypothetical protein
MLHRSIVIFSIIFGVLMSPLEKLEAQSFSCSTDMFGATRCSNGTSYTTDMFGTTRDNRGNSWTTDMFGTTRGSNGTTCSTDMFGTLRCY